MSAPKTRQLWLLQLSIAKTLQKKQLECSGHTAKYHQIPAFLGQWRCLVVPLKGGLMVRKFALCDNQSILKHDTAYRTLHLALGRYSEIFLIPEVGPSDGSILSFMPGHVPGIPFAAAPWRMKMLRTGTRYQIASNNCSNAAPLCVIFQTT
jgi:hypothetical protein